MALQKKGAQREGNIHFVSRAVPALALIFSVFAIAGSGLDVVAYGLLLLALGLPVYFGMTKKKRTLTIENHS
ncbi:MAG: hypothetical protein ACREOO_10695 [bacterium]